ncbi:MAG: hypothetical protein A2017_21790 [Lentisphaerae bacterium GWF2_44_16]|nr:MAG: hypothetical protein A2017_21790 [Lentisphaerae bacterium GWF2_44_16]
MKEKKLFAGIVEMDITPPIGYWMGGYAARTEPSKMVHDSLILKILSLFDGRKRVIIVCADLVSFSNKFCSRVKETIKKECGFSKSDVFLFVSHTHTGPLINENASYLPNKKYFSEEYRILLIQKICGGIKEAQLREEEVIVSYGEGEAAIGINRRKKTDKGMEMKPNPEGPVDNIVQVVKFQKMNGQMLAVLFKACCHPTTLGANYEISADYPGVARCEIEKIYPGVSAMFINGCCGDVRPAMTDGDKFKAGHFSDVESLGRILAGETVKCIEKAKPLKNMTLESRIVKHQFDYEKTLIPGNLKQLEALKKKYMKREAEFHGYIEKWAEKMAEKIRNDEKLPKNTAADFMILKIGDLSLLALSGEVMVEYGLKIRQKAKTKVIVAAYANEDIDYVPTAQAIKDGGYEASSFIFEEEPAPYSLDIERKLIEKVLTVINN